MSDRVALRAAIDLIYMPSRVRLARTEPLPDGMVTLLRIAAGDDETEIAAADVAGRPRDVMRQAAIFFIEQILFAPNADSYRVLGANPAAESGELRRNVALLLRWLHPDVDRSDQRSIFAGRVTAAWNDLKTPERRAAYDEKWRQRHIGRKTRRSGAGRPFEAGKARNRDDALMFGAAKTGLLSRLVSAFFFRSMH